MPLVNTVWFVFFSIQVYMSNSPAALHDTACEHRVICILQHANPSAGIKSPLYIRPAPATSASSQSATSNLSTAATSTAEPSPSLAPPAHPSGPDNCTTTAPHKTQEAPNIPGGLQLKSEPADPVTHDQECLVSGHYVYSALAAPACLAEATAGPSTAFAGQDSTTESPQESLAGAAAQSPETKPIVPSALRVVSKPHQGAEPLQRPLSPPPLFHSLSKLCTAYSGNGEKPTDHPDSQQPVHRPTDATAAGETIPSRDSNEAEHRAALARGPTGCLQQLAPQVTTARLSSLRRLAAPQGLNGPLLSRPRKRKATAPPVLSPEPRQAACIDLTMSDDDMADTVSEEKQQIQVAPPGAHGPLDHPDSLAQMVQWANMNLEEKPILEEQLQSLQGAVDSVRELQSLQRQELTDVLESIGKLQPIQMIRVRQYLHENL